jgi:pimeloyl-ACP methyl ester carboxylesterase
VGEVANEYATQGNHTGQFGVPTGDSYSDNTQVQGYCKQWFDFNKEINVCNNLNTNQTITGGQIWGGKVARTYNFQVVSNNQNDKYKYDGNKQVTILIHGWNNTSNSWACGGSNFAQKIYNQNQSNTIILCLEWSDIAAGRDWYNWLNTTNWLDSSQPDREASWVKYVAESTKAQLNKWGMSDTQAKTKVSIMGHSLGAILGGQLGKEFGGVASLTAMDPAGRVADAYYDIGKGTTFNTFNGSATSTKAFVTEGTLADHRPLAQTANESYSIEAADTPNPLDKHSQGQFVVNELYFNNPNTFTEVLQSFSQKLSVASKEFTAHINKQNNTLQFLARRVNANTIKLNGSTTDNTLTPYYPRFDSFDSQTYQMQGGNGNDIFENYSFLNTGYQTNILDFKDAGDRVSLKKQKNLTSDWNYGATLLEQINISGTLIPSKYGITKDAQQDVVVEGGRVSEVSQTVLDDVMLSSTKTSNGVFIKR